ncbi:peptidoglycan-associated lipoprotein Pal [Desulfonatronovibrio magnus]|uniref:peptidoglycan-associated lipoprotein Pal n=1 Tax=Desulfonatronovibrio magnus TaxID=698827 RepID=UPI0005EACFCB|nr:peptidoglycan-associated lipoprotein Pal [Desulfonatronovibrio magnus]
MNQKRYFILLALLAALVLSFGCGKQTVDTPRDPHAQLSEEERARLAEEQRRQEMERQALEERRLQEERLARERDRVSDEQLLEEVIDVILATRIHFAFDSYELNQEARSELQKIAENLKKFDTLRLVIEGHCDERGTAEYNLALGERRARAAYEFLILLGVPSQRLQIISYGEERPLDPRSNESAWAQNRRAEFKILQ